MLERTKTSSNRKSRTKAPLLTEVNHFRDESSFQPKIASVRNRWNRVNSDRQEKTRSLVVPQKLNTQHVFVNDSKSDNKDPKGKQDPWQRDGNLSNIKRQIRILYIFSLLPIIIVSLLKGPSLFMFFRGQEYLIIPGLWKNQNLGWKKKEEKLCKS